jgi:hypothetical protein
MSAKKLDLFDLDTKLMTSVGPVYKQQETSSRYCVANDNPCNVRRYCKLLMLQHGVPESPRGPSSHRGTGSGGLDNSSQLRIRLYLVEFLARSKRFTPLFKKIK